MDNKITNIQYYSDIAEAIRYKSNTNGLLSPPEMADAIRNIPTGSASGDYFAIRVTYSQSERMWVPSCTIEDIDNVYGAVTYVVITDSDNATVGNCYYNPEELTFYYSVNERRTVVESSDVVVESHYMLTGSGVSLIDSIVYYSASDATAEPGDVYSGKVFYNATGRKEGSIEQAEGSGF